MSAATATLFSARRVVTMEQDSPPNSPEATAVMVSGDALRAITIEAAYSWRMEHELGSIAAGKLANFTVLGEDPYAVEPLPLNRIPGLGTVYGGRWFPAPP